MSRNVRVYMLSVTHLCVYVWEGVWVQKCFDFQWIFCMYTKHKSDACIMTLLYKAFYLSRCLTSPQVPHSLTHSLTDTHYKVIFRRTVSWSLRIHKSCYIVHMLLTKFTRLVLYVSFEELYEWTYHIYHMISSLIYVAYPSMYLGVCMEVL